MRPGRVGQNMVIALCTHSEPNNLDKHACICYKHDNKSQVLITDIEQLIINIIIGGTLIFYPALLLIGFFIWETTITFHICN